MISPDIHSTIRETHQGSSFYRWNSALLREIDPDIFSPNPAAGKVNHLGRGAAVMFHYRDLHLVLRHYQRGGLVRFFNRDLYPFLRRDRTRMWREFDLLQQLRAWQLPVPTPIATRCQRIFFVLCRGDLITQTIPEAHTLAQVLQSQPLAEQQWHALGELLARFHARGVYHADLNANNILLDEAGGFHLLDFDRGELRTTGTSWQEANLARLLRSLHKLQGRSAVFHFRPADWAELRRAYGRGQSS